jgi:hypothetical protein
LADGLNIKDYLETATDAAKRVRTTIIILVVATVLLFSGFLNSFELSWMHLRLQQYQDRNSPISRSILDIEYKNDDGNVNDEPKILKWKIIKLSPQDLKLDQILSSAYKNFSDLLFNSEPKKIKARDVVLITDNDLEGNPIEFQIPTFIRYREEISIADKKITISTKNISDTTFTEIKDETNKQQLKLFFDDLKSEKKYREELLKQKFSNLQKSVIENSYIIKLPFFGVSFDINDLGFLGGLGIVIILSMLRLSLKTYILSLRIGIKAARKHNVESQFYDLLASRQLFAFPTLKDENQSPYAGWTEKKLWEPRFRYFWKLALFYITKLWHSFFYQKTMKNILIKSPTFIRKPNKNEKVSDNTFWVSTSHSFLQKVPFIIFFLVFFVFSAVVINDWASFKTGLDINIERTWVTGFSSILFLLIILVLELWCMSKWAEVYAIWNRFLLRVLFLDSIEIIDKNSEPLRI